MTTDFDRAPAFDRLKDHYKHCIRLSASNKINPKNAFELQLIDYMQDLVSTTEDGQMNFKIASSALDVGAKIYSNRVDCIQSEAQKVASSIMMALDGQQHSSNDPNDTHNDSNTSATDDRMNDSSEDIERNKERRRKRQARSKNVKTVVEDTNLLDAKLEKMVLGDSFLDGLSQDYDMSCPAALICYNALTQPSCLLNIESNNLRKNYREPDSATISEANAKTSTLAVIHEETEHETNNETENTEQGSSERLDKDGDTIMEEESEQISKSSIITATKNSATHGLITTISSSINQCSLVSLITKNSNCAKVIRDNLNTPICPRLENFLFNDRTTTISGLYSNDDSIVIPSHEANHVDSSKLAGGEHQFKPELYDNNADYGDDHFDDAESIADNQPDENDLIPNLDKIAASKPSDYGYSKENHRLLNTWAGPHAWRVMRVPQSARKDMPPKSVRKRSKLEQKPIDFGEPHLKTVEQLADKSIRFSADVIRKWKKPLLPQDHNLTEQTVRSTIAHTLLMPEETYHCMKTPADVLKLVDNDHDYTKTDRDLDAPASPEMGGFDEVHDDSDDEFRADPATDGVEMAIFGAPLNNSFNLQTDLEFAGENLIEQPYTVAQVNIPFAKIAKKMDVRKLKRIMWDLLLPPERRLEQTMLGNEFHNLAQDGDRTNVTINGRNSAEPQEVSEISDTGQDQTVIMVTENGDQQTKQGKKTPSPAPSESAVHLEFSNLYGELPIRVSSKMANDLSQPIAFVTLLHLANEKNLKLIPKQDLKDFLIEQDGL